MDNHNKKVEIIKLSVAVGMVIFGCALIAAGFIVAPLGEIHNSVLVAFGESLTFSGCLFGISHLYSTRHRELEKTVMNRMDERFNELNNKNSNQ